MTAALALNTKYELRIDVGLVANTYTQPMPKMQARTTFVL
jgi:hypothetical protein